MATSFRVKTGCLTCRQRRKKCDERKPVCTGCTRNFLECDWPKLVTDKDWALKAKSGASGGKVKHLNQTTPESGLARAQHMVFVVERSRPTSLEQKPILPPRTTLERGFSEDPVTGGVADGSLTLWRALPASFMSDDRPILLTPHSFLLLQHYLEDTACVLVPKLRRRNPFITHVLPLAYSDDLLMHAVMALSGIHLSYQQKDNLDIQLATRNHYSLLLKGLRLAFVDESKQPCTERSLRLLVILVVLCHVEVSGLQSPEVVLTAPYLLYDQALSGDPHGGIFPHLRASRQLILGLLQKDNINMDSDDKRMKGFVLEVYAYLVLANNITPYGRNEARTLPLDPFITSFETLREYETFGLFFSCGHGLFETIPKICIFAMDRLSEEEGSNVCSMENQRTYQHLVSSLLEWKSPPVDLEMIEFENAHRSAGEVYRQALLMFVKAAMCGSVVDNPKVIAEIQGHIEVIEDAMPILHVSPFVTVMLWPLMIMGSCLTSPRERAGLMRSLEASSIELMQVAEAAKLLQLLWDDNDRRAYGPFGLHLIMQKHNINFSMA